MRTHEGHKEAVWWIMWTGKNGLLPLSLPPHPHPGETVNHHRKAKTWITTLVWHHSTTWSIFLCLLVLLFCQQCHWKLWGTKVLRTDQKCQKLKALSKTFLCKQQRVSCTCGASLRPSTFFHPWPVGSRLPAGTAVRHHLSPLCGHWWVAAAYEPGGRGTRAHRTGPPQLSRAFQRLTNRHNYVTKILNFNRGNSI